MTTRPNNLPQLADYDSIPEGWSRVGAALADRLPWSVVPATRDAWQSTRFEPSTAMSFILDHNVLDPSGVEAWQHEFGLDHP